MSDIHTKAIGLRIPSDLAQVIELLAKQRLRSLNSQLIVLLKVGLANEMEEQKALSAADERIAQSIDQDKHS
jgi:hypothetical protein